MDVAGGPDDDLDVSFKAVAGPGPVRLDDLIIFHGGFILVQNRWAVLFLALKRADDSDNEQRNQEGLHGRP